MAERITPYGAFNFVVSFDGGEEFGGFSDVSGIGTEVTIAEYRAGNDRVNYVRKVPGIHKAGDVTLKRGVIGAQNLYEWLELGRSGKIAQVKRDIVVKLQSEDRGGIVVSWKLRGAMPIKWTGPTLTAKGGGDIAIEELVLSVETIEQE